VIHSAPDAPAHVRGSIMIQVNVPSVAQEVFQKRQLLDFHHILSITWNHRWTPMNADVALSSKLSAFICVNLWLHSSFQVLPLRPTLMTIFPWA
jgi:hypothetical protein